jgi:aarF domain-containing kinase
MDDDVSCLVGVLPSEQYYFLLKTVKPKLIKTQCVAFVILTNLHRIHFRTLHFWREVSSERVQQKIKAFQGYPFASTMLRGSRLVSTLARGTAYGLGGVTIAGGAAVAAYASTDQGLGLRREIRFWSNVGPVVFDYWYHSASSSPLVRYRKLQRRLEARTTTQADGSRVAVDDAGNTGGASDMDVSDVGSALYGELHERNAPKVFAVMLDLGGLYIKLGQVLSVTALPIPKQYRDLFRTLQSNVPGHEEFDKVIKPTLEAAFGRPLQDVFESIEEIPVGAASIGQAHRAKLRHRADGDTGDVAATDVIVKVQYPDAKWQVPADVQCVGDFLKLCVFFGVVDESAANLSYDEFSRQFLAELDYERERKNLQEVYESSLDENAPYIRRGVILPRVFPDLCTEQIITMTYLPGPKFEEEARKQLESLGIDTDRGIRSVFRENTEDVGAVSVEEQRNGVHTLSPSKSKSSWNVQFAERLGNIVGVDNLLFLVRLSRKILLWSTAAAVRSIRVASKLSLVSEPLLRWAKDHESAQTQADMLEWTKYAIDALFDVHGYQIFVEGLFNADAHPGNILVVQDGDTLIHNRRPKLGLIDYGQCKRLTPLERERVAKLILSVANDESDDVIASRFRELGIKTRRDSTPFLADFARLMFGPFKPHHLSHDWHRRLHEEDQVVYFPNELSMVYRASLLLRGLAMSFQLNVSVGEQWRNHAQAAIDSLAHATCSSSG